MKRRQFLWMTPAVLGALWLEPAGAQGSPVASPAASPLVLPEFFSDVARSYDALEARFLEEGRAVVQQLLDGDFDTIMARSSSTMQSMYTADDLATLLPSFTTNQVHFEVPEYQLVFDAQYSEHSMTGLIQSGATSVFTVVRQRGVPVTSPVAGTPAPTAVLAGDWTGTTTIPPDTSLAIELTFSDDGQSGTLSVPDQGANDLPLSHISFRAEQPVGERTADRSVPLAPDVRLYWARYDWGGRGLIFTIVFDDSDQITGALVAPQWQLPPDPAAELPALAPMRLPFDGLWWVFWGGETVEENYHASSAGQRHANDLVIWNQGATYHGDASKNENYWIWGQTVLAPADGTVVTVVDGIEANVPGVLPTDPPDEGGNHVVLQVGDGAYVILAHMQQGSIRVVEGQSVSAGSPIGLVGNTGNSSEPHLHIHAQNEPDLMSQSAVSLPITYRDLLVNGEPVVAGGLLQGTFIAPA